MTRASPQVSPWYRRSALQAGAGLAVAALAVGLLVARRSPDSYDADIMLQVTRRLIEHGSVRVQHDLFGLNTPYSSYGIGMSLAMAPPYLVLRTLSGGGVPGAMATNAGLFSIVVVLIFALCRLRAATVRQALATAALAGATTALLPYVATGFSELGVALGITLGLVGLAAAEEGIRWGSAAGGAGAGIALLFRTDSALLVVPLLALGALVCSSPRARGLFGFVAALVPALGLWAAYNAVRFGAPWRLGYPGQPFNHPFLKGLYGLVASPTRGLLVYAPVVVVAGAGLWLAFRSSRALAVIAGSLLLARVLFYPRWWAWYGGGGWGPRLVSPAMPVLALGILEVVRRWPRLPRFLRPAIAVVFAGSCALQVIGATVAYEQSRLTRTLSTVAFTGRGSFLDQVATPAAERRIDAVLFGVRGFPVADEGRSLVHGEQLAGELWSPRRRWARAAGVLAVALVGAAISLRAAAVPDGDDDDNRRRRARASPAAPIGG